MSKDTNAALWPLVLEFEAAEPLVITDGSAESMGHRTLDHVPGSMLLGAFATLWRNTHPGVVPDDDEAFVTFFLSGAVRWGHARPSLDGHASLPVPLCWRKKKNADGLLEADEESDNSRVVNLLALSKGEKEDEVFAHEDLPCEEGKLKRLPVGHFLPELKRRAQTGTLWNMHVSMSEKRKAADGLLFGFSSIAPGSRFTAEILCDDRKIRDRLASFLEKAHAASVRVGHARSAGYGRLDRVRVKRNCEPLAPSKAGKEFTLFLQSDYVPARSWETPLEGLVRELSALAGGRVAPVSDKLFCEFNELAAFSGMWRLPRRTVPTLVKGSVLRFTLPEGCGEAEIPPTLGGRCNEGHGRVLVNPDFLEDKIVRPGATVKEDSTNASAAPLSEETRRLLGGLRMRSLIRQAETAADDFVAGEEMTKFLKSALTQNSPSQSQLGNIRRLVSTRPPSEWRKHFEETLSKTPGEQWKSAEGYWPYRKRHEHMSDIFRKLLNPRTLADLVSGTLSLPGEAPTGAEKDMYEERLCRLVVLNLVNAWSKGRRAGVARKEGAQ